MPGQVRVLTTRDSVALGDDALAPNPHDYQVPDATPLAEVVARQRLASIQGGRATWVVGLEGGQDLAVRAQQWDAPVLLVDPGLTAGDLATDGVLRLHASYRQQRDPAEVLAELAGRHPSG